jgi:hypothetical protein
MYLFFCRWTHKQARVGAIREIFMKDFTQPLASGGSMVKMCMIVGSKNGRRKSLGPGVTRGRWGRPSNVLVRSAYQIFLGRQAGVVSGLIGLTRQYWMPYWLIGRLVTFKPCPLRTRWIRLLRTRGGVLHPTRRTPHHNVAQQMVCFVTLI